jgi:hypothetical protein
MTNINQILSDRKSIKEVYLTNSGNGVLGTVFDDITNNENNKNVYFSALYTQNQAERHMWRDGFKVVAEFIKHKWILKGFRR